MNYLSIKNWAANDRPREKLLANGVKSLSDAELLAILIGSGTKEVSAVELCRKILSESENNLALLGKKSVADLIKIKGIGRAKAITIIAALELGMRRKLTEISEKPKVTSSKEAFEFIHSFISDITHEEFWVLFLNRSNKIIDKYKLSQGGISGTVIDVRLLLKKALELLASSLIICHNHPSGNIKPSENDKKITDKIKIAAQQMDIKLLDHLIISDNSYLSFSDEGLL
jgi:DNA repair protein RadC